MTTTVVTIAIVLVAGLAFQALRAWLEMRGTRLVTCPETRAPAAVEVDLGHLARTSAAGLRELRLRDCSRWPERRRCGQACLIEVEEAPHGCLVRDLLRRWYEDQVVHALRPPNRSHPLARSQARVQGGRRPHLGVG
jgi:hypothetical protein